MIRDEPLRLFHQGLHHDLHRFLGAHQREQGYRFAVWAPNATAVEVVGDFNQWRPQASSAASQGRPRCLGH
jgi:1,4-alpha-glucan branching enzyme